MGHLTPFVNKHFEETAGCSGGIDRDSVTEIIFEDLLYVGSCKMQKTQGTNLWQTGGKT
jgi:hypothetical protein